MAPPSDADAEVLHEGFAALPAKTRARAFDWNAAFPDVFGSSGRGGFDCVLGNPPYVRQEWIVPLKPYLERAYASYDGKADLFTYFFERGVELLAQGGKLAYIASNKWLRAGYGAPLRRFLTERAEVEALVDFGHAPVFEGADTFPVIVTVRKPEGTPAPDGDVQVAIVPRKRLADLNLSQFVEEEGFPIPRARFSDEAWSLEPPAVDALMDRLRATGQPLNDYVGATPYRGLLTGYNAAFLVDQETRDRLVVEDPRSAEVLKPFVRGSQIKRWQVEWGGEWMIVLPSSRDRVWPWTEAADPEAVFAQTFPAIYRFFEPQKAKMRKRYDQGVHWWELRSCGYYDQFEQPKIFYQVIQFHPQYALDTVGHYGNDKTFLLPTDDLYLLGVLNSPLLWWFNWRYLPHMKDEALTPAGYLMQELPIAAPTPDVRAVIEPAVKVLLALAAARTGAVTELLRWLRVEHGVETPGRKLSDFGALNLDTFLTEVKKRGNHKRLSPALVTELSDTFADYAAALQTHNGERLAHERRIAEAVFEAYGLSKDDIALVWQTAPPRMPL